MFINILYLSNYRQLPMKWPKYKYILGSSYYKLLTLPTEYIDNLDSLFTQL